MAEGFGWVGSTLYVFDGGSSDIMARLTCLRPRGVTRFLLLAELQPRLRPAWSGPRGWSSPWTRALRTGSAARFPARSRNAVFAGRRRASAQPVRRDVTDSYTRPRTTSACTGIDASASYGEGIPGGGKTHRRSMDPSNEFRCLDYLWDRCRPGRRRRRRFNEISRHILRRRKS